MMGSRLLMIHDGEPVIERQRLAALRENDLEEGKVAADYMMARGYAAMPPESATRNRQKTGKEGRGVTIILIMIGYWLRSSFLTPHYLVVALP